MIIVKNIEGSETYVLRQKILRPNQTLADCKYPSDYETDTFHLGAFINDELISIAPSQKKYTLTYQPVFIIVYEEWPHYLSFETTTLEAP
jgi:hypothetical protein